MPDLRPVLLTACLVSVGACAPAATLESPSPAGTGTHIVAPADWYVGDHGWRERNDLYLEAAEALFIEAAGRAIEGAGLAAAADRHHLVLPGDSHRVTVDRDDAGLHRPLGRARHGRDALLAGGRIGDGKAAACLCDEDDLAGRLHCIELAVEQGLEDRQYGEHDQEG